MQSTAQAVGRRPAKRGAPTGRKTILDGAALPSTAIIALKWIGEGEYNWMECVLPVSAIQAHSDSQNV